MTEQAQFLGSLILVLVPLMAVFGYFGRALWKFATAITKLEITLQGMIEVSGKQAATLEKHEEKIRCHDMSIQRINQQLEFEGRD
jgi:hypothetical protein